MPRNVVGHVDSVYPDAPSVAPGGAESLTVGWHSDWAFPTTAFTDKHKLNKIKQENSNCCCFSCHFACICDETIMNRAGYTWADYCYEKRLISQGLEYTKQPVFSRRAGVVIMFT